MMGPDAAPLRVDDARIASRDAWTPPALTEEESTIARQQAAHLGEAERIEWWCQFNDPVLDRLIVRADSANTDIAKALSSVRLAQAQLGTAASELWPDIGAGASYDRIKQNFSQLAAQGVDTTPYSVWAYGMALGSWELDLWGRLRRTVEAAQANLSADVDQLRGAIVSVRAEVATAYMQCRTLQARLAELDASVNGLQQTLDLTSNRFRAGTTDRLAVNRAQADLATERAKVPGLRSSLATELAQLAQWCGTTSDEVSKELGEGPIPTSPIAIATGVPAELLQRRPDLRAAEHQYRAAVAQIGAAEAAKWPQLTLSGNMYISTTSFSGLGDWANRAYSFGPALAMPVFDGGKLNAQVAAARAQAELAFNQWRGVLVRAVAEVDSSIAGFVLAADALDRYESARQSAEDSERLASAQYRAGTIPLEQLLDVQERLFSLRDAESQARGFAAQSSIALYRALGGGWQSTVPLNEDASNEAAAAVSTSPARDASRAPETLSDGK